EHDAATLQLQGNKIAFTTDSYVVNPLFFPGGDIGSMAIHGTVNDLAMAGARPLYLSV
ncbi:MAG TPA: hydrogenase expression/formation protein HypE, partial [Planktothrix sp. UBA8407]|nr:hydrogenase expression/formation protein HypE [Planktothrix sp. UBA8407]